MAEIIDQDCSKIVRICEYDVEFSYKKSNPTGGITIDIWRSGWPIEEAHLSASQAQSLIEFLQQSLKTENK